MEFAILSLDGVMFLLRWFHFFFGIIWIGMLYYFNFVQGAFFAETDAATKSAATQKLVPRALWWFRWGAMGTFLTGWTYIVVRFGQAGASGGALMHTSWAVAILTGAALGSLMWFNVWFVIWPAQKVVIASATQVAQGGQAIPEAAARAARGGVASRTNVLFSIPMLLCMGAASHLPIVIKDTANLCWLALAVAVIVGLLELNALKGKSGPMTTIKGVIHCGFGLAVVLYLVLEIFSKIG